MSLDDYLHHLRSQLKTFLPEQQEEILAEVAVHIEDGEKDQTRASDPVVRKQRLLAELGSPADMGRGFQEVYRPNRWLDFLLIFIPAYLLFPAIDFVYFMLFQSAPAALNDSRFYAFTIRGTILLGLVMALISVRRRSLLLFAFWAPDVLARLFTLMTREDRWSLNFTAGLAPTLETLLGWALLLSLAYWLARTLTRNWSNLLIVMFALQPILGSLFGYLTVGYSLAHGLSPDYPNWRIAGFGVLNMLEIISLAGFVLLRPRSLRWAAFLLGMGSYTFMMVFAYWPNPILAALWMLYAMVLILFMALDLMKRVAPVG